MAEWELPDSQLPVDPPLGADCDVDAICEMRQQYPYDFAWCETHDETFPLGGVCRYYQPETSPQCRGDGATEPGGGAPTSEQENGALFQQRPAEPSTPKEIHMKTSKPARTPTRRRAPAKVAESVVHVEPRSFNAALLRIARFADPDGTLPSINGIHVERTQAGVALVATDRIAIAAETLATPVADDAVVAGSAFIPLPNLPLVKAVLASRSGEFSVPFNLTGGVLWDVPIASPTSQFPGNWRAILKTAAERPAVVDQVVDFNPAHLLKFERSYGRRAGLRVRFCGENNPILVTANNFVGAVMPIKPGSGDLALESVLRDLEVAA